MRSTFHKFLACWLLATYASISLLGQGLHWLTPDDGHHHGPSVVISSAHDHDHDHAEHDAADDSHLPVGPFVAASHGATDAHDCEICDFLAQAVSQPPQIASAPEFDSLVVDAPRQPQGLYSSIALGLHTPRGPPQLLA